MKIQIEVNEEIAQDAFDNACETAIAYWWNEDVVTDKDGFQGVIERNEAWKNRSDTETWHSLSAKFKIDIDGKGDKDYEVTPAKMMACLGAFLTKYPHFCEEYLRGEYNGDATSDDAWFQFAAFGDSVYG